jgi:hypothetical protein
MRRVPITSRLQSDETTFDTHPRVRRDHIDMVNLDSRSVRSLTDRHGRFTSEDIDEEAVMSRIEMLNEQEGQTGCFRQRP